MLASAMRGYRGNGSFDDLEQRLLHTLAGHVTGDRRIFRLPADLVDFVDIDDATLGSFDIVACAARCSQIVAVRTRQRAPSSENGSGQSTSVNPRLIQDVIVR